MSVVRALARARLWRLAIALVALVVAAGAWLPVVARLAAGPAAHVCHCDTRGGHAHCACPICFPELREVETFGHPSVSGSCGDEELSTRPFAMPAVAASPVTSIGAPALASVFLPLDTRRTHDSWSAPPPTPPPEGRTSPST